MKLARSGSASRVTRIAQLLVPVGVLFSVWAPVLRHYRVSPAPITADALGHARVSPPESVLTELDQLRLLPVQWTDRSQLVLAAESLLQGVAQVPGYPPTRIHLPFDARDLHIRGWELAVPGFVVPRVLLDAYQETGREEFLLKAQDVIHAFGAYERRAWLPNWLLWNDHAVAARVNVLAEIWRLYRVRPDYRPAVGKALLAQAARHGELLARPGLFTTGTNHGVMQNLALFHLSAAFPTLRDAGRYQRLALDRLREQMAFYVNDEGVVLEHSAGYHAWGVALIGMACRYLTLLGEPIPPDWIRKHDRARSFLSVLTRPDGSLPTFGDTHDDAQETHGPSCSRDSLSAKPDRPFTLHPAAGYAVWWGGLDAWPRAATMSQTVVAWSHFPGHAHKHADGMSVLLWAGGQTWWDNVGYWPYWDYARRLEAMAWDGASGPHLVNESAASRRTITLLSSGASDRLTVVDLKRTGPGPYSARRQVVHLRPRVWLVVDHVTGGDDTSKTRTTWTAPPDVALSRDTVLGFYRSAGSRTASVLRTFIIASPGTAVREYRGSFAPFAGWHVVDGIPRPAPAIVIEQPAADSWSFVIWALENESSALPRAAATPRVVQWRGPEAWTIQLGGGGGGRGGPAEPVEVRREEQRIMVQDPRTHLPIESLQLRASPDVESERTRIRAAFASTTTRYPKFEAFLPRRTKVTVLLAILFITQEVFFLIVTRVGGRYAGPLRAINVLAWLGGAVWLALFFLKP